VAPAAQPQPGSADRQLRGHWILRIPLFLLVGVLLQGRAAPGHGHEPVLHHGAVPGDGGGNDGGGWLSERLVGPRGVRRGGVGGPVVGLLASAGLLLLGLAVAPLWAVVTCLSLALATACACEGPCWTTAVELGGRRGGTAAGIFNTGGNLGGQLAPWVTPW